jgi:hypothetical protein
MWAQTWAAGEWTGLLADARAFVRTQARHGHASGEGLEAAGLTGDHAKVVRQALAVRWGELTAALVRESVAVGSVPLADFDWAVKVTQSSSKVAAMQVPRLSMQLVGPGQAVTVELTLPELRSLLASLDAAQGHVRELSA